MEKGLIAGDEACMNRKIIVIDDPSGTMVSFSHVLERAGYGLIQAYSLEDALALMSGGDCSMLMISWSEFDFDGLNLLKKIKYNYGKDVITVICTKRKLEFEIVTAFNTGADDVFRMEHGSFELLAKINALFKLSGIFDINNNQEGQASLSLPLFYSEFTGERFSKKETAFFKLFLLSIGKCVSLEEIVKHVWPEEPTKNVKSVLVAVTRFRKKLYEIHPGRYKLMNVHRAGYRLIETNIPPDDLVV